MKIAIIGASGKAGSRILTEAINRGHDVTAIVRDKSKVNDEDVAVIEKDVFALTKEDVEPFEVIVNAFGAPLGEEQIHVNAGRVLIEAVRGTDTRIIVVGGAGSLFVDEEQTTRLVDTPEFPEVVRPTARGQMRNLFDLQQSTDVTWTFISPSAEFDCEGTRTGSYKKGKDNLLVNSEGDSYISYADYAIAVVDEIENKQHLNERITVVGERQ